jgi:hypothetical protein
MTSNHFFDNQLAFSETLGTNISQSVLDTELCNHHWSTTWSRGIPAGIKRLLISVPTLGDL